MKKYFYSLSLSLSLSLVFFLSSLNVYAQSKATTKADTSIFAELYNQQLYSDAQGQSLQAIYVLYLFTSGSDDVATKQKKAYQDADQSFFNIKKSAFKMFDDGQANGLVLGVTVADDTNPYVLFAPGAAVISDTTNGEWIVVAESDKEVKAFFPAEIRTQKNVSSVVDGETVAYTIYHIHFVTYEEFKKTSSSYDDSSMGASGL